MLWSLFHSAAAINVFVSISSKFGSFSLSSLDQICNTEAANQGRPGAWTALIGSPAGTAASRALGSGPVYDSFSGKQVSSDFSVFFTSGLSNPVLQVDGGSGRAIWSGSNASESCNGWTTTNAGVAGTVGNTALLRFATWFSVNQNFCSSFNNWLCGDNTSTAPSNSPTASPSSSPISRSPSSSPTPNPTASPTFTQITYSGGPLLNIPAGLPVYLIFYGAQWTQTQRDLVYNFVTALSESPYFSSIQSYSTNGYIISAVVSVQAVFTPDSTTFLPAADATNLDAVDIPGVIEDAISNGLGPDGGDPNSAYLLLTDPSVTVTNRAAGLTFCQNFCGTHGAFTAQSGTRIAWGLVGNGANRPCPANCPVNGPNNDPGVDGMLGDVAVQLVNVVINPTFQGWSSGGGDVTNICYNDYGAYTCPSYCQNVQLGSNFYIIPSLPVNNGGTVACYLQPPPTVSPTSSPTPSPTASPTRSPTAPTPQTRSPTRTPTANPTRPTKSPTSASPTRTPTNSPSRSPTSASPTRSPTVSPTATPTNSPTRSPSSSPSRSPSRSPTRSPTRTPSRTPTRSPS